MKVLLDTHAFMWWDSDPGKLSPTALAVLRDPGNILFLSACSVWEMVIKADLGKLALQLPINQIVSAQQANGIQLLPISVAHALAVSGLPFIHRDPFDRLLVAQALVEGAVLLTADPLVRQYPVSTHW